jgi:hypothetical protein
MPSVGPLSPAIRVRYARAAAGLLGHDLIGPGGVCLRCGVSTVCRVLKAS